MTALAPFAGVWGLVLALAAATAVHAPACTTFFAQDDLAFLAAARGLAPADWSIARPLAGPLRWQMTTALFGLDPLPHHLALLVLHLVNVVLVWTVGRRLMGAGPLRGGNTEHPARAGAFAATAAALMFGASPVAFTPLHWVSGMGELMVTTFALLALLLHLSARARDVQGQSSAAAIAGSAACVALAIASKESAVLLPLVLLVVEWRAGDAPPTPRRVIPAAAVAVIYGGALALLVARSGYLGGEPYAADLHPGFLLVNLATYLRWTAALRTAVPDAVATADPSALAAGLAWVALALGALLWQRRDRRHPAEVGAAWFAALLLPVLPLAHHTYLYYVYPALPGACWLVAAAGTRVLVRVPASVRPPLGAAAAVALLAIVALGFGDVRARERARTGDFAADRTMRESGLLRQAIASLDAARLPAGAAVGLVNPTPRVHTELADVRGLPVATYTPLEAALRGGLALRLFEPGLTFLGLSDTIPRPWERAELFIYHDDGSLRPIGRGGAALTEAATLALRAHRFDVATRMFERSRALGDTLADATFGLIAASGMRGDGAAAHGYALEFLRRWPGDPRAQVVRQALAQPSGVTP